jgi:hypothetical protein
MKLLQKRRSRSKHQLRYELVLSDFDRVRLLYRVLEVLDNMVDVNDWTIAGGWGAYGDRRQTDALRTADVDPPVD